MDEKIKVKKSSDTSLAIIIGAIIIAIAILVNVSNFQVGGSYIVGAAPNTTINSNVINNVSLDYGAQNPLSTNGDSIYFKDIDLTISDVGNFKLETNLSASSSEILASINQDLHIRKFDNTTNSIKNITLAFSRPVLTTSFGLSSSDFGNFSNVKIYLKQGQLETLVVDESTNDIKYVIRLFDITPVKFDQVRFEFHTTDEISIGIIGIFKNIEVASRLQALSELTNTVENINSFRGALLVDTALVHRIGVNQIFTRDIGVMTNLTVNASPGNTSITVNSTVSFSIGDTIKILGGGFEELDIITITNIVSSVITLDRQLSFSFPIGSEIKVVQSDLSSMAASLSNPVSYRVSPPEGQIWQITRLMISITDNTAMDDSKFGGINALTNGVVGVVHRDPVPPIATVNWKKNGDMALDMFDVIYTDKSGGGNNGLRGKWTFTDGEFIIQLDGDTGDFLEILIQDDITSLNSFNVKAQGRLFGG